MSQYLVPFTVALLSQFQAATAIRDRSEEALYAAQLEAEWLNDGITQYYAQSEAADYGGPNEEPDSDYWKPVNSQEQSVSSDSPVSEGLDPDLYDGGVEDIFEPNFDDFDADPYGLEGGSGSYGGNLFPGNPFGMSQVESHLLSLA